MATVSTASSDILSSSSVIVVYLQVSGLKCIKAGCIADPSDLQLSERLSLAERHPSELAELEDGEEVDDDLDAGGDALNESPKRHRPPIWKVSCEIGHGRRNGYGVDGDMAQVDDGSGLLLGRSLVGSSEHLGGHAAEQVRGLDDESFIEPGDSGNALRCGIEEPDEKIGGRGIGPKLEKSGEEEISFFPPDEILVAFNLIGAGKESTTLDLEKDCCNEQELAQLLEGKLALSRDNLADEGINYRSQLNLEDVHLVRGDQVQEQFNGPAEDRRRHDVRHTVSLPKSGGIALGHASNLLTSDPMARVLSGIQPSGDLHLGNYFGAVRNWVADQDRAEAFYCIVDLHALTLAIDPEELRRQTLDAACVLLASGLDPDRCTLFVQSHVPAHQQLTWLLECTATMGELRRMTQFKDKGGGQESVRVGLFTYPVLMAADILLYDADEVPVGDDQRQHLELTREVAGRFNHRYGDIFTIPKATIPKFGARVMDLQNPDRKMSKSSGSPLGTVGIMDPPDEIVRKVKKAVTDADGEVRYDPESKPGLSNLLGLLAAATGEDPEALAIEYDRYGDLKAAVADALIESLAPLQERYRQFLLDPSEVRSILTSGAHRAAQVAGATYERASNAVGLLAP